MSRKKSSRLTRVGRNSKTEVLSRRVESDEGWERLKKRLPEELDTMAVRSGAVQRWRKLRCASDLIRLALLYGFASMGLYTLVTWAARAGLVRFSAGALGYRLSRSIGLLGQVLGCVLQSQLKSPVGKQGPASLRIILNDASVLTLPGSVGTDLRMHTNFDLAEQRLSAVRVTGAEVGERLDVVAAPVGALEVADMGLSRASGLHAAHQRGVLTLTRIHFQNLRLETQPAVPVDIKHLLRRAAKGDCSTPVLVPLDGHQPLQARLLIRPFKPEAAARARQKLLKNASKKGKTPDKLAIRLAGYLCLLTTAPEDLLSNDDAFRLYRLRWQIELAFKRYKSLLGLKQLRKANDPLLSVQILAKLIVIALVEQLVLAQMPQLLTHTLYSDEQPTRRPEPSLWRLTHLAGIAMFGFLAGPSTWWYNCSVLDSNLLCEGKRRRRTAQSEIASIVEQLQHPQVIEFAKTGS